MDYHIKDVRNRQKSSEDFLKEYYFKSQQKYFPANGQKQHFGIFRIWESPKNDRKFSVIALIYPNKSPKSCPFSDSA